MAVNLSTRQFGDDNILVDVATALARHQIPANQLELEITESVALKGFERTITLLTAFKKMGLLLSIDDFGTGYSSLSYLKRFPVDALKVDQSFVRNIDTDAGDAAITRAVVALAHSFGLSVIAEGVETLAQRDYLTELGCELAQGYWFSKPLPPEQAALLLARGLHPTTR
jgi:EAL domain-containing protein (putative c-di-GMP-specific phosphodiesterase class I)